MSKPHNMPSLWDGLMRLAIIGNALSCIYVTAYPGLRMGVGPEKALALMISAALLGALIGPHFKRSWAAGIWNALWASIMTTVLAAALALGLNLVASALYTEHSLTVLAALPATMLSGSIIAPLAILGSLEGLLIWLSFTVLISWIARKSVAAAEEEAAEQRDHDTYDTSEPSPALNRHPQTSRKGHRDPLSDHS